MEINNDAAVKALSKAAKEENFAEMQVRLKQLWRIWIRFLDFSPRAALSEKSRAKAEIWEKWDEFSKESCQR